MALTELELGVTALMAVATAVAARRHPPTAFALVLVGLLLASASINEVRDVFLTARWGGLVTLPLALSWPLPRKLRDVSLELVAVGITGVLALSALWSIEPELTLMRAASFGLLLLSVARLVNLSGKAWNPPRLVDAIAFLAVAVGISSLLVWLFRPDIAVYVGELRGVLENQNGLGLFLGLTYPFLLAAFDRRFARRIWVVALSAPVALMIGLTESRSGALALVAGLITYELATRFPRRLLLHLLIGVGGFLAVSLSLTSLDGKPPSAVPTPRAGSGIPSKTPSQPPPDERPDERPDVFGRGTAAGQGQVTALLGARNEGWSAAAELILDRPLLGYGFGSGDRVFARYPERADFLYFQGDNPNSGYLQSLLELGFVFSLVILLPLVYSLVASVRAVFRRRFTIESAAFFACLVGGLLAAVFESLLTAAGAPWAMLIWLSAAALLPVGILRQRRVDATAPDAKLPTLVETWVRDADALPAAVSGGIHSFAAKESSAMHSAPAPETPPSPAFHTQPPAHSAVWAKWLFLSVLAFLAVAGALGAFAIYVFGWQEQERKTASTRPAATADRPRANAFAQQVAAARCQGSGCTVAELAQVTPGLWRLRLSGVPSQCFLLDIGRFVVSSSANLQGLAAVSCASVPLRTRDVLTVASPAVPGPATSLDDPRIGIQTDVVKEIARRLGVPTVRWRSTPSDRLAATAQRYDIAIATLPGGVAPNESLVTSRSFFGEEIGVFVADGAQPPTAAEIASRRIAAGDGVALRIAKARFPAARTKGFPLPDGALAAVVAGRAEAAVVRLPLALSIRGAFPGVVLAGRVRSIDADVFVAKLDSQVLAAFDRTLAAMERDGALDRIHERWYPGSTTLPLLG